MTPKIRCKPLQIFGTHNLILRIQIPEEEADDDECKHNPQTLKIPESSNAGRVDCKILSDSRTRFSKSSRNRSRSLQRVNRQEKGGAQGGSRGSAAAEYREMINGRTRAHSTYLRKHPLLDLPATPSGYPNAGFRDIDDDDQHEVVLRRSASDRSLKTSPATPPASFPPPPLRARASAASVPSSPTLEPGKP